MDNAVILATGSYVPERAIQNDTLAQYPDASKMLISQKTGVFSRRHADTDQCTSDLALLAAKRCLARIDFPPEKLQAIILSTSSPDRMQPATATRLQHLLGAVNAFAFDINSVCSGSAYGIALAQAMIRSGACRNLLFVAAEAYSKILNPKDFSTFPYFGDGAGAVLFAAGNGEKGVLDSVLGTDGQGNDIICVPGGGTMLPFNRMSDMKKAYFRMKGRDVFSFAITRGTEVIRRILDDSSLDADQIKCFICHQANINIILKIAEALQVNEEKFYINLFRYGNTASASVLIAMDEA
ncbi:MAG: ketoacyl-ACP synthase III, partial [Desulfatitalea sp.]|nr:ketoacyl-ACP synthase III [Desulfatitalea sp.]NNK01586.1 ketoacyl-ACP synthase III [Desulfatitalea sp.]